ncbi:MAG: EamA family transporter [Terriglobales bacterium]
MARVIPARASAAALVAALLFGASTPLAKQLLREDSPMLLAGLLYLGSGVGLSVARLARDRRWHAPVLARRDWLWLLLAIGFGGVLGPLLLMLGLMRMPAASASLLLNLEAVLTALLAWTVFRENTDRRVALGMALIVAGAAVLAGHGAAYGPGFGSGAPLIGLACLCWALDNNLTRKVSASDAVFLAALKGLAAGGVNTGLALLIGERLPAAPGIAEAMTVGLFGYGVSLVLFVLALRGLGAARTSAYFSTAPFLGAAIAVLAFGEHPPAMFWLAAVLMMGGVWLHLQERHEHVHTHPTVAHTHRHIHEEDHRHSHGLGWDARQPHTHEHTHGPLTHNHPHYPDIHHQHGHGGEERP